MAFCPATVVSIQDVRRRDAVAGHLSWGLLLTQDRVLVLTPDPWLDDPSVRFEVLIASQLPRLGRVERIGVASAQKVAVEGAADGAVAMINLAGPARHAPNGFPGGLDVPAFAQRLAGGDIWRAFEEAGAVDPELRARTVPEVLGPVIEWEQVHRVRMIREVSLIDATRELKICCLWDPRCCVDCPGRWW